MRISDFTLLDTTNLTVDTNSDSFQIEHLIGFSMDVTLTASSSMTGSLVLQASNDNSAWHDITSQTISGASGSCLFNVTEAFYKRVRLQIKVTTGEILTLTAKVYSKGW